jgi:glycosyltransferase involved in cell wall biosynthesis
MTPIVTAVIPAFNAKKYIEACLASVFEQGTRLLLEAIVVNDGSTDSTWEKIANHGQVILLDQPNLGPAAARNAGIKQAQGEYIAFLNADDRWPEGKLQKQIELLQQHPDVAMCFGDCRQFDGEHLWSQTLFEERSQDASLWEDDPYLPNTSARLLTANFITTGSVVVRRQVLEDLGDFDANLRLVEYLELWLRIARHYPIIWCRDVCLLRRRHADNTSRKAEAMSLAYLGVLKRQQDCCEAELARNDIDLSAIVAREYREMAERALTTHRPEDATRWAWQSFTTQPNLQALRCLLLGTAQKPRRDNPPT